MPGIGQPDPVSTDGHPRILMIRGGALGDFILTLPALALLRDGFPGAHIEVLGYRHIVALAEGRRYAHACRSIEYGPLARFFGRGAALDPDLSAYFAGFQQIVSYLYDPDRHFEDNLLRCGARRILRANPIVGPREHASRQLARPLEALALYLEDHRAAVHPSEADRAFARGFLDGQFGGHDWAGRIIALHPGSGSPSKNWPAQRWEEVGRWLLESEDSHHLLLVSGEADRQAREALGRAWSTHPRVHRAENLALTELAGVLECCRLFLGHDSGISHLAAAVGAPCVLLFGPSDPDVWAPAQPRVRVLRAPDGTMASLDLETVRRAVAQALEGT